MIKMKKIGHAKTWISLIVLALLVVIIIQNIKPVSTRLLFVTIKMPRAALLAAAVALGFALGQIFRFSLTKRKMVKPEEEKEEKEEEK